MVGEQALADQALSEGSDGIHMGPAAAEKAEQKEGGDADGEREHQLGLEHPQLAGAVDFVIVVYHTVEEQHHGRKG